MNTVERELKRFLADQERELTHVREAKDRNAKSREALNYQEAELMTGIEETKKHLENLGAL